MFSEALRVLDDPGDRVNAGYSSLAAGELAAAFKSLPLPDDHPAAFVRPFFRLKRIERARMSVRQRMLSFYGLGLTWRGLRDEARGIEYLDRALDIAQHLNDLPAAVDLLRLVGTAERARSQYRAAAGFLTTGLEMLDELRERGDPGLRPDPAQELTMHVLLAVCHHAQEEHAAARSRLDAARRLIPQTESPAFHTAKIDWMMAAMYRASGDPAAALPLVRSAADAYALDMTPSAREAYARLQVLVAETAMDLVEESREAGPAQGGAQMLALAHLCIVRARELAGARHDPPGDVLTVLARVRLDRLGARRGPSLQVLEDGLARARELADLPLLAQVYTAYGDELAAREEHESALNMYRATLDLVRHSHSPVMGVRARRALVRAMRVTLFP